MRFKKLVTFTLVFALFALSMVASDFEDILKRAKEESEYYQNSISLSLKSLYSAELLNYDKEHKFKGGVRSGSWSENLTNQSESKVSFTPYFSYESNNDNTTTVELSAPINLYYMDNLISTDSTYSPSLSISQNVLLNAVKDEASEFSKRRARLNADSLLKKVELQYEMSLYNAISSVLTSESSYFAQKAKYAESKANFDSLVKVNNLQEGTYAYDKNYAELLQEESRLEIAQNSYQTSLESFRQISGFDYDGIENIREANFDFAPLSNGNTEVQIARLDMEASKNKYDVLLNNDDRVLSLSLNTTGGIKGSNVDSWGVGGGLSYKDTNFSIGVSAGGAFKDTNNWRAEPTVGFELNYQSGSYESETKRLNLQNALIDYRTKAFDYETALMDYNIKSNTMISNINAKKIEALKAKAEFDNAVKDYENVQTLNEKGYYSSYSLDNAIAFYKSSENTYKAFLLSCLILENESKILNI